VPEIDEIPIKERYIAIILPPRERACYLELQQQAATQTLRLKSSKIQDSSKISNDRVIFESESIQEALIKGCSYFPRSESGAQQPCEAISEQRRADLKNIDQELQQHVEDAVKTRRECLKEFPNSNHISIRLFDQFFAEIQRNTPGDLESSNVIDGMYEATLARVRPEIPIDKDTKRLKVSKTSRKHSKKAESKASKVEAKKSDSTSQLRNLVVELRRLTRNRVGCQRGLRFIENVFAIQQLDHHTGQIQCSASQCHSVPLQRSQVSIIGICGHIICHACLTGLARNSPCITVDCPINVSPSRLYSGSFLGRFDDRPYAKDYQGKKIEELIQLIGKIPGHEQVLLFIQFGNLAERVYRALADAKIRVSFLKKNAHAGEVLARFQAEEHSRQTKVLMCCVDDESASGS
jgi:hypothetical protein